MVRFNRTSLFILAIGLFVVALDTAQASTISMLDAH